MPCWAMPMIMPPITLMNTISTPAIASPRTNFEAPSIAPKKPLSSSSSLRRSLAVFSSISPAERSASIAICLPGMASRWKRAATSAMRPEPLVMTTKLTITRMMKTMMPMTKLPPITKLPNASMTCPGGGRALVSVRQDQPRRSEVQRQPQHRRDQSTVGNDENSSGAWMNSDVIRIRIDRMIETASSRSSTSGAGASPARPGSSGCRSQARCRRASEGRRYP